MNTVVPPSPSGAGTSTTTDQPGADHVFTLVNVDSEEPRRLTIVVPTRNEAANIGPLFERLATATAPLAAEIVVVDDSTDDTPATVEVFAEACPLPVRLLHRPSWHRGGGLAGAVMAGIRAARGPWVLVMDADLQHPPEVAAALATTVMRHDVDVVIGTRYAGSGSVDGLDGAARAVSSSGATQLAKSLFPRRLATVTDPMSGLFAFRRSAIELDRMNPIGFKILLELLVRNPRARVAEVAYTIAPRNAGESKASLRVGLTYLRHLTRLRRQLLIGQLRARPNSRTDRVRELGRLIAFGVVGLSGVGVNTAALWLLYSQLGLHHLLGAALATQASTSWNFLLIEALVYRGRGNGSRSGRITRFFVMNNLLLLGRLPVLQGLISLGMSVLVANAMTLVALFLLRFLVSDRVIYRGGGHAPSGRDPVRRLVDLGARRPQPVPARKRSQYLPYRYDVAGIVTVGSQIVLPELEFFRAQWIADGDADITIRTGDVGRRRPCRRASMTEHAKPCTALRYEEHLGRAGANFMIEFGERINVVIGPLLARSPHVIYTNVVEALLRFVMISRGSMLLHSACVSLDGTGVMLSALTDTGKTATVLRLLRDHGGEFLSDDMTVIDADGNAVCFPKPLTISSHTLRAVKANELTPKEWRRLRFQSRLHSKNGRSLALALARFNVPIMGINAITQRLVPPPKYAVDRLVPCKIASAAAVQQLFIIERGSPHVHDLDRAATLERLIENTDDAYGFPPFAYLAPAITINGLGYQQLRERERDILASFLSHVRTRVIASDKFGWADEIPRLVDTDDTAPADEAPDLADTRRYVSAGIWPRWETKLARESV